MSKKKTLIIGDNGYIGSRLFSYLEAREELELDGCDLNIWGKPSFQRNGWAYTDYCELGVSDLKEYGVVILLAGNSSPGMCKDPFDTYDQNVHRFLKIVKKIKEGNPKCKFIYASSAAVCERVEARETDPMPIPKNPYDASKQIIDKLMTCFDLDFYGLRFGTVAGASPNMRWELLVNSMLHDAKTKGIITVSNPKNYRAVLCLEDLCRAIEAVIFSEESFPGFYNLASFNTTIGMAAEMVKFFFEDTGRNIPEIQTVAGDSTYSFSVDTNKFEDIFNFEFKGSWFTVLEELDRLEIPENKMYYSRTKRCR